MSTHMLQHQLTGIGLGCACYRIVEDAEGKPTDLLFLEVNEVFEEITGLKNSKVRGKSIRGVGFETRGTVSDVVSEYIAGAIQEGTGGFEQYFSQRDRWFQVHASLSDGGTCTAVYVDISSFKRENIREQYEQAVGGSNDGIWDWDLRDNTLFLSSRWKDQLGFRDEELPNEFPTFEGRLHPDDHDRVMDYVDHYLRGETEQYDVQFRMLHKNGSYRWIRARGTAVRDGNGMPVRMAGSHTDITEQKKVDQELREREELMRTITSSARDAIVMLDPVGNVSFWNPSAERIFGYSKEEMLGKRLHDILTPGYYHEAHKKAFRNFQIHGKGKAVGRTLELEGLNKKGAKIPIELSLSAYRKEDGWHAVGIMRDITRRKKAEVDLIQAKEQAETANRAKSEFLANMSHEIRTPLNGVIGFTDLLMQTPMNDLQIEYARNVNVSGRALLEIVNDILDFSKIEAGRLELDIIETDLTTLLDESMDLIRFPAGKKGLELLVDFPSDLPKYAHIDPLRVKQILVNLMSNAVKFTEKGEVELKLVFEDLGGGRGKYVFLVRDTGIGIRDDQKEKLFKAFSQADSTITRRFGGTGLGLVISNLLAAKMGSSIEVESEWGRGSTFRFSLSTAFSYGSQKERVESHRDEGEAGILTGTIHGQSFQPTAPVSAKILISEDVPMNMSLLKALIHSFLPAAEILEAVNGKEAIEQVRLHEPHLVFMDVQMPEMDGLEASRRIREMKGGEKAHPVIIALTAGVMKAERDRAMEAGMNDFLSKPVNQDKLKEILTEYLACAKYRIDPDDKDVKTLDGDVSTEALDGENPAAEAPVIHFDRKAFLENLDNDTELFGELLRMLSEDLPAKLASLEKLIGDAEWESGASVAHSIKGLAANMHMNRLFDLAVRLENFTRRELSDEVGTVFSDIKIEWEIILQILKSEIE